MINIWPNIIISGYLILAVLVGMSAYVGLMMAMRMGEVSAITPFRYSRLIFGITLGVAMFQEELTVSIITGSVLIVLSGLFILWREASR